MRRFTVVLSTLLLATLMLGVAQAAEKPAREYIERVSGGDDENKHPSLAVSGDQLALAYSTGSAILKIKQGGGRGFGSSASLGSTDRPTYFNHAVAAGVQPGLFHSVWSDNGARIVYRASNGSPQVVADGLKFAHFVDIAVTSNGAIFVVWRTVSGSNNALYVSYSNNGTGWSSPVQVNAPASLNRPRLATGPNNTVYLIFGGSKGDIFFGRWNGTTFGVEQITSTGQFEADPTVTATPDGAIYAAWRVVDTGAFWAVLPPGQGWQVQPLAGGNAAGPVAIDADAGGNVHVAWSGKSSGRWETYYRVKPAGSDWSPVAEASANGEPFDVNVDVAGTAGSTLVGHVAFETFHPDHSEINYVRFLTRGGSAPQPTPPPPPPPTPVPPMPTPVPPPPACDQRFPETNQCVSGRLLQYWNASGGLPVFGLPLNAEADRKTLDGTYRMQLFERNRLELHPEQPAPYDVLLGRLGGDILYQQGRPWETLPREQSRPGCLYFAETQHNICEPFLSYWQTHGLEFGDPGVSFRESLALFGLPLTSVNVETNPDGFTGQTQWFERARFEFHPENQNPYRVLLGRLGAESGQ